MARGLMLVLSTVCLACWILMFMAGTDIWHDAGRFDVLTMGATAFDVRAFAIAFYGLFFVLLVQFTVAAVSVVRARPSQPSSPAPSPLPPR